MCLCGRERTGAKALERAQLNPAGAAPAADQVGHGRDELHRLEEVCRNLRLALEPEQAVEQAQRCVFDADDLGELHATDGREHHVNKRLEGGDHASQLLGNRQQKVVEQAAHIDRQMGQVHLGGRHFLAILPVPVHHQVGAQLGHGLDRARHAEDGLQLDVGVDTEDRAKGLAGRLAQQLRHAQSTFAVAAQVYTQHNVGTAGLERLTGRLSPHVGDLCLEEQELALGREGLAILTIEVGQGFDANFGLVVAVGGQVKTTGRAQAEAKIERPTQIEGETAIDVQRKARQVEVQRDVHIGTHQRLAQLHVELDRIFGTRRHIAKDPVAQLDAVFIEPGDLHIQDVDHLVVVDVLDDVQTVGAKQVPQGAAHNANRPALAREFAAQILQQAHAHIAHEVASVTQLGAQQGDVAREFGTQGVLHHTQRHIHTIDDAGGVVEHAQQAELAEVIVHDVLDVGHRNVEQFLAGHHARCAVEETRQTSRCGGRCEIAQGQSAHGKVQLQRQVHAKGTFHSVAEVVAQALFANVKAPVIFDCAAQLVQLDCEGGKVVGAGQTVAIDRGPAALHAQLGRPRLEPHAQVLSDRAHTEGDVSATGLLGRHTDRAPNRDLAEQLLAARSAEGALLTGKKLHVDPQLGAEPRLHFHQCRLTSSGQLVTAMDRIGVARLTATEPVRVDEGTDALDTRAGAGDGLTQVAQHGLFVCVGQHAAAVGKDHAAQSGHGHLLHAGGVVVVQEKFGGATTKANARLNLQLGHGRQGDVASRTRIDHVGQGIDKIKPGQCARAGNGGQLLQVQAEAKFLLKQLVELEVHVQRVAVEAKRKHLILWAQAVVVGDAQGFFKNALDLANGRCRVVGRLLHLIQETVDKREDIGQRAAHHRQFDRIKRLVGDRIAHKLKTHAGRVNDVRE